MKERIDYLLEENIEKKQVIVKILIEESREEGGITYVASATIKDNLMASDHQPTRVKAFKELRNLFKAVDKIDILELEFLIIHM